MSAFLVHIFVFLCVVAHGQSVRSQIGTSVWKKDGKVFAGPSVSYIIDYNRQGNKTREWQVSRDTTGNVVDTNYAELDDAGRLIHFYGGKEHWYSEYDSLGAEIKIVACNANDTFVAVDYLPYYEKGRLIRKMHLYNGQPGAVAVTYTYKGHTVIENQSDVTVRTVKYNKLKQQVYVKDAVNYNNQKHTSINRYRRDTKGNVLYFTKQKDGKLIKSTKHFFKNGVEQYQVEHFYNPEYIVTTTFTYQYLD